VAAAAGRFLYDPSGSPWAFSPQSAGNGFGSGIAANNSYFTVGNPPAPEGSQVAFLQGAGGWFSQDVTNWIGVNGWIPGSYQITFKAAQRARNPNYQPAQQDFEVLVDGNVVGTFTPSGTSYQTYTTAPFTVTAGAHTITFQGLDTAGGDNTAFIDQVVVSQAVAG
jgi:hypothetical protein